MHPTLGRYLVNTIILLLVLDAFALLLLNPNHAAYYVAILSLIILGAFFVLVVYDIRREAGSSALELKQE